jgi:YD repeat-containing protein
MTTPNTLVDETSGEATALASQALAARPPDLPITWPVEHNGLALTAVAMHLAPTPIVGGYADSWTDAAVPLAGGQTAAIVRAYNSVDTHASVLGPGWSLVLPALAFSRTPLADRPGYFNTAAELAIGPTRIAFRGVSSDGLYLPRDLTGEYDALGIVQAGDAGVRGFPDGFAPVPAIPGQPIEVRNERDEPLQVDRFALLAKDGRVLLFDPLGRFVGLRDAAGNQVDYRYDGERLVEIRDGSQRGIRLDYDARGRLAQLAGSDGSTVRYGYDANGNLVTVSDEAGTRSEDVVDGANRLAAVLDEAGRRIRENAYDSLGRVINTRAGALAEAVQVSYDSQASSARYVANAGAPSILQYDSQKRLSERTDRLGNRQTFRYDADGRLVAATDPKGQTTTYLYDSNGFLTEAVSPLGERTRWLGYSQQGVPQASIDAANQLTFFEYDERGRVKAIASGYQFGELSADGSLSYSEVAPEVIALTYDSVGNLSAVQDPAGATTRYSYDAVGNLAQTTLPEGGTITQTYDERSRLKSLQDPSGFRIDFDYDPRGQVTQIASPAGVIRYAYAGGRLAAVTDPAGRVTQFGFDAQGRLATVVEATDTTTTYEYDPASNLSAVVDAQGGRTEFQYDAMNRLVARVQRGSGGAGAGAPPEPTAVASAESSHSPHGHAEPERSSPTPAAAALAALKTPAPGATPTAVPSSDESQETPVAPDSTADTSPVSWIVLVVAGGALVLGVAVVLSLLLVRSNRQKRKKARARQRALDESYDFPDRSDDSGW